jgi:hypothetical protein
MPPSNITRLPLLMIGVLFCLSPALGQEGIVGIVEGDTIWLNDFAREVGRKVELHALAGSKTGSDIIEETWQQMVSDVVIHHEARRRGMGASRADVERVLLEETPDYVKRGVVDEKGRFDKNLLKGMLTDLDSTVRALGKGRSREAIERQTSQMRETVEKLVQLTTLQIEQRRLKETIRAEATIDSGAIQEKLAHWTRSVRADVIYMPCGDYGQEPNESELRAWYDAHTEDYRTTKPLRRLTFLSWPIVPTHNDSSRSLQEAQRFAQALKSVKGPGQRDSMWYEAGATFRSGTAVLHADSAAHRPQYEALEGKAVGDVVGPIQGSDGLHLLLVDSIIGDVIHSRVIILPFQPSQETVDGTIDEILKATSTVKDLPSLRSMAEERGLRLERSPYFTADEKVFDSYLLVDKAFSVPLNGFLGLVDTPERDIVLAVVSDTMPPGVLPFEAARPRIVQDVMKFNACKSREKDARKQRAIVTLLEGGRMFISVRADDATFLRDAAIDASGLIGESILDPLAARIITNSSAGLVGPFLGDAGWYTISIIDVTYLEGAQLEAFRSANVEMLADQQREDHWLRWLESLKQSVRIDDRRWQYFQY